MSFVLLQNLIISNFYVFVLLQNLLIKQVVLCFQKKHSSIDYVALISELILVQMNVILLFMKYDMKFQCMRSNFECIIDSSYVQQLLCIFNMNEL